MKVPAIKDINRRRIYIAGPMRGRPAFNYPAFNEAEKYLTTAGWLVENPARIGEKFGTPEQINADPALLARVVKYELDVVRSCDAIFLLPGWEKSEGARRELATAIACGAHIILEDCGNGTDSRNGDLCRYIKLAREKIEGDLRIARERRVRYAGAEKLAADNLRDAEAEVRDLERALTAADFYQGSREPDYFGVFGAAIKPTREYK